MIGIDGILVWMIIWTWATVLFANGENHHSNMGFNQQNKSDIIEYSTWYLCKWCGIISISFWYTTWIQYIITTVNDVCLLQWAIPPGLIQIVNQLSQIFVTRQLSSQRNGSQQRSGLDSTNHGTWSWQCDSSVSFFSEHVLVLKGNTFQTHCRCPHEIRSEPANSHV